jgi:hypothetical protein
MRAQEFLTENTGKTAVGSTGYLFKVICIYLILLPTIFIFCLFASLMYQ